MRSPHEALQVVWIEETENIVRIVDHFHLIIELVPSKSSVREQLSRFQFDTLVIRWNSLFTIFLLFIVLYSAVELFDSFSELLLDIEFVATCLKLE